MLSSLEPRPVTPAPGSLRADFGLSYLITGFVGWMFAASAPLAILLTVGHAAGVAETTLSSWLFGAFFINGLLTVLMSWTYRQPLVFFWTIPGAVLVAPALKHLAFAEVIGAYLVTGVVIAVLGVTGWVRRAMQAVPMPIVMGMVAGVFLRFGLDLVRALHLDMALAGPMVLAWLVLSVVPGLAARIPALIGVLVVGALTSIALGRIDAQALSPLVAVQPVLQTPAWSLAALIELVVPLAITVLVVQNGQGFAVLKSAGHEPPVNALTLACGVGAIACAAVGAISTCLTGPANAIITSSGERHRHYVAALSCGAFAMLFGLLSPAFTKLMLQAPKVFIMTLAGLAMLRVLQGAFQGAFKDKFSLGALVSLLVTVADLPILNIGAAFWGLVAGIAVSWLLERRDFSV